MIGTGLVTEETRKQGDGGGDDDDDCSGDDGCGRCNKTAGGRRPRGSQPRSHIAGLAGPVKVRVTPPLTHFQVPCSCGGGGAGGVGRGAEPSKHVKHKMWRRDAETLA